MTNRYLRKIDPLVAFVDYIKDTKPYHTKILEVLEEYVHIDNINITMIDKHFFGDTNCSIFPCYDCEDFELEESEKPWRPESYCEWKGIEILHPPRRDDIIDCLIGYSSKPFGSPGYIPIISPNQSLSFTEYPAIDETENLVHIPGDYTSYLKVGNKVSINISKEDLCNVDKVWYEFRRPGELPPGGIPETPEFYTLILKKDYFTASKGQRVFNTTFDTYVGNISVYVNGIKLTNEDYLQTSTNSIFIINNILSDGDIIEARSWITQSSFNVVRKAQIFTDITSVYSLAFHCDVDELNVYINGVKLKDLDNYRQISTTQFTLTKNIAPGDVIEAEAWISNSDMVSLRRKKETYTSKEDDISFDLSLFESEVDHLDVYNNGTKLIDSQDYTQTSTTNFQLDESILSTDDIIYAETIHLVVNENDQSVMSSQSNIKNNPGILLTESEWQENYFIVDGNRTDFYTEGLVFYGDGISYRKKFVCITSEYYPDMNQTAVLVYPIITEKDIANIRYIGLLVENVNSNQYYTIDSITYSGGTIPSWSDRNDANTFQMGDDPHTKVTFVETLPIVPTIEDQTCQAIVAFINVDTFPIEKALGYSNYLRYYDFNEPPYENIGDPKQVVNQLFQTPDEGHFCAKVLKSTKSTFDSYGHHIPGSGKFEIDGLLDSSNIFVGDTITIKNSPNNTGTFTITLIEYDLDNNKSVFSVEDLVVADYDSESTDCGVMTCYLGITDCQDVALFKMPANVLMIDGDYTNIFLQGKRFEIEDGSLAGEYTTHSSRFINGQTHIKTTSTLLHTRKGFDVVDIVSYTGDQCGIVIDGDVTQFFKEGEKFNIIDSESNDGFFEVKEPGAFISEEGSYDPVIMRQTEIPIDCKIELIGTRLGYAIPFKTGVIKQTIFGYSEYEEWCSNIPYTVIKAKIDENLEIVGSMLSVHDDVIAYNLENSNLMGYELSVATIFSDEIIQSPDDLPRIPEDNVIERNDIAPTSDPLPIFWFDTNPSTESEKRLNRYIDGSPGEWVPTNTNNTIWWVRTETHTLAGGATQSFYREMYYKKIYYENIGGTDVYSETDWIMDLPKGPGYPVHPGLELVQPARGNLKLLNTYSFAARLEENEALEGNLVVKDTYEIQEEITEDIYYGSPPVPDKRLVNAFVNNIRAHYEFVDVTEVSPGIFNVSIEIIHPNLHREDIVVVEVLERLDGGDENGWQHNAHVGTFDSVSNNFYHKTVGVFSDQDPEAEPELAHGAYIVGGGNFLNKFINETQFVTHTLVKRKPEVKVNRSKILPVLGINRIQRSFTIDGDYSWFFSGGRICKMKLYRTEYVEFEIFRSFFINGQTLVELVDNNPPDRPADYEKSIFYRDPITVLEIDNITDVIIVPCDRRKGIFIGDEIEIVDSVDGNNGVYSVTNVTYDFAFDRTDVEVSEDLIAREIGTNSKAYLSILSDKHVLGVVYEPAVQKIKMDDYNTTPGSTFTDATFVIPTAPVNSNVVNIGIDYFYRGPTRIETDYNGPDDNRAESWDGILVNATDNTFTIKHSGYKTFDYETPLLDSPPGLPLIGYEDGEKYSLDHQITPGKIFNMRFSSGFYGCTELYDANDGYYVVKTSTYDISGEEATIIEVETDYELLPPYGNFTINTTSIIDGVGSRIAFNGNIMTAMDSLTRGKFYISELDFVFDPINPSIPGENAVTIINYWHDNTTRETLVDVKETIIDGFSGEVQLVDYSVKPGILYDETTPGANEVWNPGTLEWKGHSLEDNFIGEETIANTTITEVMSFDWKGDSPSFILDIETIDPIRGIIILKKESDILNVQIGDKISLYETINNNGTFSVLERSSHNGIPFIKVKETLAYGTVDIIEVLESNKIKVTGSMRNKIKKDTDVIIGGTNNKVKNVSYVKPDTFITLENGMLDENISAIWFKERKGKVKNK